MAHLGGLWPYRGPASAFSLGHYRASRSAIFSFPTKSWSRHPLYQADHHGHVAQAAINHGHDPPSPPYGTPRQPDFCRRAPAIDRGPLLSGGRCGRCEAGRMARAFMGRRRSRAGVDDRRSLWRASDPMALTAHPARCSGCSGWAGRFGRAGAPALSRVGIDRKQKPMLLSLRSKGAMWPKLRACGALRAERCGRSWRGFMPRPGSARRRA